MADKATVTTESAVASTGADMASTKATMASPRSAVTTAAALRAHRSRKNHQEARREGEKPTHSDIIRPFRPGQNR